jgi:hypothetical protein
MQEYSDFSQSLDTPNLPLGLLSSAARLGYAKISLALQLMIFYQKSFAQGLLSERRSALPFHYSCLLSSSLGQRSGLGTHTKIVALRLLSISRKNG